MKDIVLNNNNYSGISKISVSKQGGGTAQFQDVDEVVIPTGSINITQNGTYDVADKASAVVNVSGGTSTLITKNITENGTYSASADNADGYSSVTVNVSGGGDSSADDFIEGTVTDIVNNAVTKVGNSVFMYSNQPTSFVSNSVTIIEDKAFQDCTTIESVNCNNCTEIGLNAFYSCNKLNNAHFPAAISVKNGAFRQCVKLTYINLPLATEFKDTNFYGCSLLKIADFGAVSALAGLCLQNCSVLDTLILRNSSTIVTANNAQILTGTPIASGTGYIYVPNSLIADYQADTVWTTYSEQFKAFYIAVDQNDKAAKLEDSSIANGSLIIWDGGETLSDKYTIKGV